MTATQKYGTLAQETVPLFHTKKGFTLAQPPSSAPVPLLYYEGGEKTVVSDRPLFSLGPVDGKGDVDPYDLVVSVLMAEGGEGKNGERFFVVDLDGFRGRPQLDLIQDLSSLAEIWVDGGAEDADDVMDLLMAGAGVVVCDVERFGGWEKLREAFEITDRLCLKILVESGRADDITAMVERGLSEGLKRFFFTPKEHLYNGVKTDVVDIIRNERVQSVLNRTGDADDAEIWVYFSRPPTDIPPVAASDDLTPWTNFFIVDIYHILKARGMLLENVSGENGTKKDARGG